MSGEEVRAMPIAAQCKIVTGTHRRSSSLFLEKLTCRCVKPTGTRWLFFRHPQQLFQRTAENSSGMFYCKKFKLPLLEIAIALVLDRPVCQKNRRDCKKSSRLQLRKQFAFTHFFLIKKKYCFNMLHSLNKTPCL